MLDKSVPYVDVVMRRKSGVSIPDFALPEGRGFSFACFRAGDERAWAEIESSVLEFDSVDGAEEFFKNRYLPYLPELERRCIFINTDKGEKVATATAWWGYTGIRRDPWLAWVAVKPEYQKLGLGRAVVSQAVRLMTQIEGERDFFLHTQTWSHRAIRIYESVGFIISDEKGLGGYANDKYVKAVEILGEVKERSR